MDFLINGFPSNDSHEKKNSSSNNNNDLPPDIQNFLNNSGFDPSSMNMMSGGLDDLANMLTSMLGLPSNMFSGLQNAANSMVQKATPIQEFENGKASAFHNRGKTFKTIEYVENENLKSDFFYVKGITSDEDIDISCINDLDFYSEDIDKDWFFENNKLFSVNGYGEKYLICSTVSTNEDSIGLFFAIIQTDVNKYAIIVPKYGNTYKGKNTQYSGTADPEMFNEGTFKHVNMSMVRLALDWMMYEKSDKTPYLSPVDFGDIRIIPSAIEDISGEGTYVKVGHIITNNNNRTNEFKNDIGENRKTFDFYIHLSNRTCSPTIFTEAIQDVDFNSNKFIAQHELMYRKGYVYIDCDFGNVPEFLFKIKLGQISPNDYLY